MKLPVEILDQNGPSFTPVFFFFSSIDIINAPPQLEFEKKVREKSPNIGFVAMPLMTPIALVLFLHNIKHVFRNNFGYKPNSGAKYWRKFETDFNIKNIQFNNLQNKHIQRSIGNEFF